MKKKLLVILPFIFSLNIAIAKSPLSSLIDCKDKKNDVLLSIFNLENKEGQIVYKKKFCQFEILEISESDRYKGDIINLKIKASDQCSNKLFLNIGYIKLSREQQVKGETGAEASYLFLKNKQTQTCHIDEKNFSQLYQLLL